LHKLQQFLLIIWLSQGVAAVVMPLVMLTAVAVLVVIALLLGLPAVALVQKQV
jgi:hypothetical protein